MFIAVDQVCLSLITWNLEHRSIMKNLVILVFLASCGNHSGSDGKAGLPGSNGLDGLSLVVDVQVFSNSAGVTCNRTDIFQDTNRDSIYSPGDTYQNGFLVCDGAVGANGAAGRDGLNGSTGENGLDGLNGAPGLDANMTYQVVEIIDPCGQQHPHGFDEVILKLGNGKYLASFSDNANGLNTRFGILPPGSYVTTDGTNCHFIL